MSGAHPDRGGPGVPKASPDLAVIGAGSAGFAAAIRAAELGAEVTLFGHGTIGGTCVNIGCVPSKTLIRAADAVHQARAASRFAAVNGTVYKPGKVVITTGATPAVPPITGIASVPYLTSTEALDLDLLPASLVVIGGGVIGCELGQMFARAGVRVTILCRSRLLPESEPEIGTALTHYLSAEGLDVRCGVAYETARPTATGGALTFRDALGQTSVIEAERFLIATGRRPNTAGLGLDQVGVALNAAGGIQVDDRMRTTKTGIYAAGDVTGRDMFVYMAAHGAKIAAENALNGDGHRYDASAVPEVTFTDPQLATAGLTEAQARAQGYDARSVVLSLDQVPRALAARDPRGLIKLVAERRSGKLLGAHILAPEAGDSIQTAVLAIKHGLTVTDLAETIFPYLTTVEGLKLAALGFSKDVTKLSCCAG